MADGVVQLAERYARVHLGHLALGLVIGEHPCVDVHQLAAHVSHNRRTAKTRTGPGQLRVGDDDLSVELSHLEPGLCRLVALGVVALRERGRLLVIRGDRGRRLQQSGQKWLGLDQDARGRLWPLMANRPGETGRLWRGRPRGGAAKATDEIIERQTATKTANARLFGRDMPTP